MDGSDDSDTDVIIIGRPRRPPPPSVTRQVLSPSPLPQPPLPQPPLPQPQPHVQAESDGSDGDNSQEYQGDTFQPSTFVSSRSSKRPPAPRNDDLVEISRAAGQSLASRFSRGSASTTFANGATAGIQPLAPTSVPSVPAVVTMMKVKQKRTISEWRPSALLLKIFNVPDPYSSSSTVTAPLDRSKTRDLLDGDRMRDLVSNSRVGGVDKSQVDDIFKSVYKSSDPVESKGVDVTRKSGVTARPKVTPSLGPLMPFVAPNPRWRAGVETSNSQLIPPPPPPSSGKSYTASAKLSRDPDEDDADTRKKKAKVRPSAADFY